jgi:hypothetical protein
MWLLLRGIIVAVVIGAGMLLTGCGHVRGLMQLGGCDAAEASCQADEAPWNG